MKIIINIIIGVALLGLFPISSFALTISPPTMEFIAEAGETITDVVKLYNETPDTINLTAEIRDFKPLNEKGTPNFLPIADKNDLSKISNWIDVKEKTIILKPNERKNILFTINIPNGASPGGHFAGILWTTPSVNKDSVGIASKARTIEFSTDKKIYNRLPIDFSLRFENMGNIYLKPTGEIKIKNIWGKEVTSLDINPGLNNALPESVRQYNLSWQKNNVPENLSELIKEKNNFAFGRYRAIATLDYGTANQTLIAEKYFWVFPCRVIGLSLIAILIVFLISVLGIKRYNRWILKKYGDKS